MATAQNPAPNGRLTSGVAAASVDVCRDDMLNLFEQQVRPLADNTAYYESQRRPDAIGITTPPQMQKLLANVGYPRLYVNALSERLEVEGFRLGSNPDADTMLWDWWQANDLDVESTLGHTEALVHGRSYVTVAAPDVNDPGVDPTVPIIRVESPLALYAVTDPRTRQVTQAIRAVYDDARTKIVAATLYLPDQSVQWVKDDTGQWQVFSQVNHGMGMVPVVPLTNRSRLSDLNGTSEITPELRSVTDAAARVMMDMQATAELMAVPQRLLFGVKPEDIGVDPATGQSFFDAYLSRILAFEDPDSKAQQFSAAELRNFTDVLQELAKQAAAYTGLPPQYLSSATDNPASAEAIKASESRLVKNVENKARVFGGAWELAMRVAYKAMNSGDVPPDYYRMESVWRDPSTPTYASKADAATKLYANGLGVIPKERARIDMGYSIVEREEMKVWDSQESPVSAMAGLYNGTPAPGAPLKDSPSDGSDVPVGE